MSPLIIVDNLKETVDLVLKTKIVCEDEVGALASFLDQVAVWRGKLLTLTPTMSWRDLEEGKQKDSARNSVKPDGQETVNYKLPLMQYFHISDMLVFSPSLLY